MQQRRDENAADSQLQQHFIQIILHNKDPDGNDVDPDEMKQLISYLDLLFIYFDRELDGLSWQTLLRWFDLLPETVGVAIHKLWVEQKPVNIWECFWWGIIGAPKCWQFEIEVQAYIPWQYAVVDTLDTARKVAQEAYEKSKPY